MYLKREVLKDAILPSMIFLMLLRADLRDIAKLGPRMIISFFTATFTIMIGFTVAFMIFLKRSLADNAPLTFGNFGGKLGRRNTKYGCGTTSGRT